ncbi:MAG: hypothetical protein HY040_26085 [Planctomycetes bacterium]|nr:hypothetical protein [Planctomycetota bacterium]
MIRTATVIVPDFAQSDDVLLSAGLSEIEVLEAHLQSRLGRRVRDFRLRHNGNGLVLNGHASTYYAKQLAQQAVMEATDRPILANDIVVS